MQVGAADIEEGVSDNSHLQGAGMASANGGASEEPAGLGPASQALAQMQNLRKVCHAPYKCAASDYASP